MTKKKIYTSRGMGVRRPRRRMSSAVGRTRKTKKTIKNATTKKRGCGKKKE